MLFLRREDELRGTGPRAEPFDARRRPVGLAAAGIAAQSANSLSNLIVAVVVARMLGLSALGEYGFMFSLLLTFVAMQTGWVGDSLVVLGRSDVTLRRGITWTQFAFCIGGGLCGTAVVAFQRGTTAAGVAAFGVLVVVWQLEEYTRRALMARLAYWRQGLCDASYGLTAVAGLAATASTGHKSLPTVLWCMVAGASVAAIVGWVAIAPDDRLRLSELRGPWRENVRATRSVASFGGWRAAQLGVSQGTQTLLRVLVLVVASSATLGTLEAARLVTAPLNTFLLAVANMTLPLFVRARTNGGASLQRLAKVFTRVLPAMAFAYGAVVLVFAAPATHLLVGADKPANRIAIAGWAAAAVVFGYSNVFADATLAGGASAQVFRSRLAGSITTLASAGLILYFGATSFVPSSVVCGAVVSATLIRRHGSKYLLPGGRPLLSGVR